MKIACISDLHGNLIQYPSEYWKGLEECELLLICGDILPLQIQFHNPASKEWLLNDFLTWANSLPTTKVLFIAGNHDQLMERDDSWMRKNFPVFNKVTYIKNELYTYIDCYGKNYRIFGTPYCHQFGNWPFMRSEETLVKNFEMIPENIDILFSHDAPYGTSDICLEGWAADGQHKGCPALRDAIISKKPKYCFHGHLHSTNHEEEMLNVTKVYNTSILDESYRIKYEPIMIRI